jgi:DNA polymerase-3 subunit chi
MPDIRFIGVTQEDQRHALARLCKALGDHVQAGRRVVICTPDADFSQRLDQLLWTFEEDAFVPHVVVGDEAVSPLNPVLLTHRDPGHLRADVFVNFAPTPLSPSQIEGEVLVYELFRQDKPDGIEMGRLKWAGYKSAGLEPQKHSL